MLKEGERIAFLLVAVFIVVLFIFSFSRVFEKFSGNVVIDEKIKITGKAVSSLFDRFFGTTQELSQGIQGAGTYSVRNLPDYYTPGTPVAVNISVNFDSADCGGAVIETLPAGWSVNTSEISGEGKGVYNSTYNNIIWAPIFGTTCGGTNSSYILGYLTTPNSSQSGVKNFTGGFYVDGSSYVIAGDTGINQTIPCTNECTPGNLQCSGNGYQMCGNYDSDLCYEWGSVTSCFSGQMCTVGICITNIPTNLRVNATTQTSISLVWGAVNGATYKLYRSQNSTSNYTNVINVSTNSSTNLGLTAGTVYYYKVSAVVSGQESELSGYASGNTSNKLNPSLSINIAPNKTVVQGQQSVVNATGCPFSLACNLTRNGTNVINPDVQTLLPGNYTYVYSTLGDSIYNPASVSDILIVNIPFNFSLISSGPKNVSQGSSVEQTINSILLSGTSQVVSFNVTGLSSGLTASFSSESCQPTCTVRLNLSANFSAVLGSKIINVSGIAGSLKKMTQFNLSVNQYFPPAPPAPFNLSAKAISVSEINLSWIDNSSVETNFNVYRGISQASYSKIASIPANSVNYKDSGVVPGVYYYKVRANNSGGESSDSNIVSVASLVNLPPSVDAGSDEIININHYAFLNGNASDDGLPSGILTIKWSKASGPGNVEFASVNSLVSTANFSKNGSYVLQLSANDSVLTGSDTVNIYVNAIPNVSVVFPLSNSNFTNKDNITILANVVDDSLAVNVEFFANGVKIGENNTSPYRLLWNPGVNGTYIISARATDLFGAEGTSSAIVLFVNSVMIDADNDGVPDNIDACPGQLFAQQNMFGYPIPPSGNFVMPTLDDKKLENISGVFIESPQKAAINYLVPVNLYKDSSGTCSVLDIGSFLIIENNLIELKTENISELNATAEITFYNISFTNPKILRDGTDCTVCSNLSYNSSDETLRFTVSHFTKYEAAEDAAVAQTGSGGNLGGSGGGGSSSAGVVLNKSKINNTAGVNKSSANESLEKARGDILALIEQTNKNNAASTQVSRKKVILIFSLAILAMIATFYVIYLIVGLTKKLGVEKRLSN